MPWTCERYLQMGSPHNYYSLRLAPGRYALTARSAGGLTCNASATAVAGETVNQTITCLVP